MRLTVTFNRLSAPFIWASLGLFGVVQHCHACGDRVRPRNLGALSKDPGGKTLLWHRYLTCIMDYVDWSNITERSQKENDGKPKS